MKLRATATSLLTTAACAGVLALTGVAQAVTPKATIQRNFYFNGYCNYVKARITDGIVYANNYNCVPYNLGGVVVTGIAGIPDGTIVIHGHPPDHVPGTNHYWWIFPDGKWIIYHVTKDTYFKANEGTYTDLGSQQRVPFRNRSKLPSASGGRK